MNVAHRDVAIVLSEEGRGVIQLAAAAERDLPINVFYVQETDDVGLWIRVRREDGEHLVLIRWEFILSMDVPARETKAIGLKPKD
ncbi:MAG: hypothetical protein ACRD2L_00310 [Terriglobia bacterium]